MNSFKKGIAVFLAGTFAALTVASIAYPQGAVTLVQIVFGGTPVSSSNGLPVNCITGCSGGGGGGAATIANGADVAEGSTTDAPCTLPASSTACTIEAINKAIANAVNGSIPAGTNLIGSVSLNTTPSLANGNGVVPTQGGTALSATNGGYTNLLQGNAALSAANPIPMVQTSQYPSGATPITASATGTTAATTATLAASASIKTYICGFSIRANATAAATANSTVTGTITGTLNYTQWTAPNASGIGLTEQIFTPCVPSSAINTGIAVISAAPGTGGVVSVAAWGYQL